MAVLALEPEESIAAAFHTADFTAGADVTPANLLNASNIEDGTPESVLHATPHRRTICNTANFIPKISSLIIINIFLLLFNQIYFYYENSL